MVEAQLSECRAMLDSFSRSDFIKLGGVGAIGLGLTGMASGQIVAQNPARNDSLLDNLGESR
jgi:hypothetical protein